MRIGARKIEFLLRIAEQCAARNDFYQFRAIFEKKMSPRVHHWPHEPPSGFPRAQLKDVINALSYPAREIALFILLTSMSVSEVCGLHWKFLNLSPSGRWIDNEFIAPNSIAVRHQNYRGELTSVIDGRRKLVRAREPLYLLLGELRKTRRQFVGPQDFVLTARNGSPVHPENIAARHLKSIGQSLQLPWLSWAVFQRTRLALQSEVGGQLPQAIENMISG